jgi:hypothetical protein
MKLVRKKFLQLVASVAILRSSTTRRIFQTLFCMALFGTLADAQGQPFQFGHVGDTGYSSKGSREARNLFAALNRSELAFVVHVGDFQADGGAHSRNPTTGPMPCTDESYQSVYELFQSIRHPLVLTPGDNDWADCGKIQSRTFDPLERLTKVRATFFPQGRSLGQNPMPVESQSNQPQYAKFRENLRWSLGGVTFVTLHITGSNDNLLGTPATDAEHQERKAANLSWMREAFAKARADSSLGLVVMTQANPGFENYWPPAAKSRYFGPFVGRGNPPPIPKSAFDDYVAALIEELESYDKPVAYLHGDSHLHRIDKPLYSKKTNRIFENFTRVETFGDPDTHWVRVMVDPKDSQLFTFKAEIVPENTANARR